MVAGDKGHGDALEAEVRGKSGHQSFVNAQRVEYAAQPCQKAAQKHGQRQRAVGVDAYVRGERTIQPAMRSSYPVVVRNMRM